VAGAHLCDHAPKIVPVETLQSMLDEPSSGSKATHSLPALAGSTIIGSSFSSETSTAQQCESSSALTFAAQPAGQPASQLVSGCLRGYVVWGDACRGGRTMISLLSTSSFLTSSPEEFEEPWRPNSPAIPALRTALEMPLHAMAIAFIIIACAQQPG
jgi:hypothetical protein